MAESSQLTHDVLPAGGRGIDRDGGPMNTTGADIRDTASLRTVLEKSLTMSPSTPSSISRRIRSGWVAFGSWMRRMSHPMRVLA